MGDIIPSNVKKKLEADCNKIAKKVGKAAKPVGLDDKAKKAIRDGICKEVKNLDKHATEMLVSALKSKFKKEKPKSIVPHLGAKVKPVMKAPGSGVPSLTFTITDKIFDKSSKLDGKVEVKLWADPRDLEKKEKGGFLNLTVTFP